MYPGPGFPGMDAEIIKFIKGHEVGLETFYEGES